MDNQNEIILHEIKKTLDAAQYDTSFLDDDRFDFNQKFAQYRSARLGFNRYGVDDPNISADEMDDIIDVQIKDLKSFREQFNLDPRNYNFAQMRELTDAFRTGLDVTPYLDNKYSAEHMYIAKTFQQEGLPGIEQVHPDKSIDELIQFRQQTRQLMHESKQTIQSEYTEELGLSPQAVSEEISAMSPKDIIALGSKFWNASDEKTRTQELNQLLKYVDANYEHPETGSLLYNIVTKNDVNNAIFLIQSAGANPNHSEISLPPLFKAIQANNSDMVSALINAGAEAEIREHDEGYSALEVAVGMENINPEILKNLIRAGADVSGGRNIDNLTAFEIASTADNEELLSTVLIELEKENLDNHQQLFNNLASNFQANEDVLPLETSNNLTAELFYEKILHDIEKSDYSPEEKDYLKFRADEIKKPLLSFPKDKLFNEELQRDLFDIDHLVYSYRASTTFYEKTLQDIEKSDYLLEEKDYLKFRASFEQMNSYFTEENFNIEHLVNEYRTDPRLQEQHYTFMHNQDSNQPQVEHQDNKPIFTNADILKHYEKISPELVEQVRRDGGIDVPGVGGGQWNLKDEDPEYLAQLFAKATGEKIPGFTSNVEQNQNQEMIKKR